MRIALCLLLAMLLAGCASAPVVAPSPGHLFQDHRFAPPASPISARDVFALSDDMKRYLSVEIGDLLRERGRSKGLYEALYSKDRLKIEYDTAMTRTAAEAFRARSGNCLSLAIMTAALAKELGLTVGYQGVDSGESWSRESGLYISSRHVNVTLGRRHSDPRYHFEERNLLTIDYVAVGELQRQRAWPLGESTIVAMYMNNRAAEVLAEGRLNDAYWWARAAIEQDPGFLSAQNTLGVIYRRQGYLPEAEQVLQRVLEREPRNTHAMSNLAKVYADQGRVADSWALAIRLAQIEAQPPFHDFDQGIAAMKRGDFREARESFAREVARDSNYHEFHFWLAAAHAGLGEYAKARRHLGIAMENSTTRREHDLYAAKLDQIKSNREVTR